MPAKTATAIANANIALIKYWGNRDESLRLPANGSISMTLEGLNTQTRVTFEETLPQDTLTIDGQPVNGAGLQRVSTFLDEIRRMAGSRYFARVESHNNFPAGTGIASSASAFAALSLAASQAAGLDLSETELSKLARHGSGSACRSVPGGFVEWRLGTGEADSYAVLIAPPDHWDLVDCLALISKVHKSTSSTAGHALAGTSPLQAARLADAPRRLEICRNAILQRDFEALADIVELDSNLMHAVMMTSRPPLFYWLESTLGVMQEVRAARARGLPGCYTIDAGPNVHVLCALPEQQKLVALLGSIPGVEEVRCARVGGPARIITGSSPLSSF